MQNKGLIWASDRSARRLDSLKRRASRAQLFNYRTALWDGSTRLPTKAKFNGILLDAPCSGIGTWQRNPNARWTVTPDDVRELAVAQRTLLENIAGSLKPGGRLVYAVCTLTRSETTDVVASFTGHHPELEPVAVFPAGYGRTTESPEQKTDDRGPKAEAQPPAPSSVLSSPSSALRPASSVFLWPHELNANGMFIAAWRKR